MNHMFSEKKSEEDHRIYLSKRCSVLSSIILLKVSAVEAEERLSLAQQGKTNTKDKKYQILFLVLPLQMNKNNTKIRGMIFCFIDGRVYAAINRLFS